ncbi:MAG: hypothetical protein CMJ32_08460 [Phycisphaerae bacterium]|nr:hypothetical protein [Phycisphaerae bacterium]
MSRIDHRSVYLVRDRSGQSTGPFDHQKLSKMAADRSIDLEDELTIDHPDQPRTWMPAWSYEGVFADSIRNAFIESREAIDRLRFMELKGYFSRKEYLRQRDMLLELQQEPAPDEAPEDRPMSTAEWAAQVDVDQVDGSTTRRLFEVMHADGTRSSGLDSVQLKALARSGFIDVDDEVRQRGADRWVPAWKVGGVFAEVIVNGYQKHKDAIERLRYLHVNGSMDRSRFRQERDAIICNQEASIVVQDDRLDAREQAICSELGIGQDVLRKLKLHFAEQIGRLRHRCDALEARLRRLGVGVEDDQA